MDFGRSTPFQDQRILLFLAAVLVVATFGLSSYLYINADVAFLVWAADQVLGPAVYGRDILDVNPPLCMLIYVPAALLAQFIGFDWGIRIWMLFLSLLALLVLWQVADRSLRASVATVLVLFLILAYPHHYAQREQIAFLLCAPYVAGPSLRRSWGLASGIMAGIGFLMKPYFLIPLALVFALRRRLGDEERAILLVGIAYGLVLVFFFQPYLFEMVPAATATYWAISYSWYQIALQVVVVLVGIAPFAMGGAVLLAARPFLMATLGFTIAAVLQSKGFMYHFIPAFGFLVMSLTVGISNPKQTAAKVAGLILLLQVAWLSGIVGLWLSYRQQTTQVNSRIQYEIDRAGSFASLHPNPFPAFPAAIYTHSKFTGIAICQIFLPAVKQLLAEQDAGKSNMAYELALSQAKRELGRKPNLVFTTNKNHDGTSFNYLDWLLRDEEFRDLWKDYEDYRIIGPYSLYRLR
jgi:hypothetical protein